MLSEPCMNMTVLFRKGDPVNKILVIGSAVADVVIELEDPLPRTGEDVHVRSQQVRMGGCGFNCYDMIRHFNEPCIPFFPVGTGLYGDFIRKEFALRGIRTPVPAPDEDNGCCYCFIEPDGERTFISNHGAEYRFRPEWFSIPALLEADYAYICGLEIEESTGVHIVSWLETRPDLQVFFAPGPRLERIDPALLDRIFRLSPILHLNGEEACRFTGCGGIAEAADSLHARTGNIVLITLGRDGCCCRLPQGTVTVPGFPAGQIDANGAGDAHIGAVIACMHRGMSCTEAVRTANRVAAAVVEVSGALLSEEKFLKLDLPNVTRE